MYQSYKDLKVWQRAIELVVEVYKLTEGFPHSEVYGLVNQMRRAAVAIPSNIAEGQKRGHKKDFVRFLCISCASG
ncbi:MAG: four helix bundle protein, partial [bacterium]|nr:four helix bundle protein [bacterium]